MRGSWELNSGKASVYAALMRAEDWGGVCYTFRVSSRAQRAAKRRAEWTAEVVERGEAKGPLYSELSFEERLAAFVRLNLRVWKASGQMPLPALAREDWPGEIFEIKRDD